MHRGSRKGLANRGNTVAFGEYGLMALERCWMDTKQIEAARVAIARNMKRHGKMWIRIFPQKSFTKKPLETRMGTGKGEPDHWAAEVKPGTILDANYDHYSLLRLAEDVFGLESLGQGDAQAAVIIGWKK